MSAFVVVDVTVRDPETYEQYKTLAQRSVEQHGGVYVARGGATEVLEGRWQPKRLVILEFPSVEAARRWWDSPEYAEAKAIRQRSASTDMVVVEGYDAPAPQWTRFRWYANGFQADAVRELLETQGIPVLVKGQQPGIFGVGFLGGPAELLVPAESLEEARTIVGPDDLADVTDGPEADSQADADR
jgi:uncharacterized protein (DUF1330 family)